MQKGDVIQIGTNIYLLTETNWHQGRKLKMDGKFGKRIVDIYGVSNAKVLSEEDLRKRKIDKTNIA